MGQISGTNLASTPGGLGCRFAIVAVALAATAASFALAQLENLLNRIILAGNAHYIT